MFCLGTLRKCVIGGFLCYDTTVQLVEMAPCDFIALVLDLYRIQLAKFWPDENIDLNERHQHELFNAYKRESGSKLLIDKQDHKRSSIRNGMI